MAVQLVCGHGGWRRPVVILRYEGPLPVPQGYSPRGRGATFELRCSYCGFAPRPGDEGLRALLTLAAASPAATLDISAGYRRSRPR